MKEVKSNKDVVQIFEENLSLKMNKIVKKIEKADHNKFDVNDFTRRDDSIDPTYNDHLL